MKLNKKQLPFFAAAVQTIQYSFGGWLYFSWIGIPVVGSMGALISFSVAYAASQISDIAKGRKFASWLAMSALMLLSPIIIGTSLFYSLPMITNPVWRGVVSGVWGLLPDGATALAGFIAGKGLIEQSDGAAKKSNAGTAKSGKGARNAAKSAKESGGSAAKYPHKCDYCDEVLKSANAVGGHMKKHHPEKCKPRVAAEVLFENVKVPEKVEK